MNAPLSLPARTLPEKRDILRHGEKPWPRLSETLPGPKHPNQCQKCGRTRQAIEALGAHLQAWQECGQRAKDDPKESIYVLLCTLCNREGGNGGKRVQGIVSRHPRFYHQLASLAPVPGIMGLCVDCAWRDGTHCSNAAEKVIEQEEPDRVHLRCSPRSASGFYTFYNSAATACSGWEMLPAIAELAGEPEPAGQTTPLAPRAEPSGGLFEEEA